jgi:hypothetical protein
MKLSSFLSGLLEETDNLPGREVNVHIVEAWTSGEAGNRHHIAADRIDKSKEERRADGSDKRAGGRDSPCTNSSTNITDCDREPSGDTFGIGVCAEGVLGLGHTDW